MNDAPNWLLYGTNGYTGELIARHAVALGQRPILAGRNAERLTKLAGELGCEMRIFSLAGPSTGGPSTDAAPAIAKHVSGTSTVLNCAGPFSRTARPMVEACLLAGANYLDITGEIAAIEAAAGCDARARAAGVTLMPAVGFDVVPTDCLAALLAERLPGAVRLELAFAFTGGMSRGTAKTMLESLPQGGRRGSLAASSAADRLEVDAGAVSRSSALGDDHSLGRRGQREFYTTGIPNIEVYAAAPRSQIRLAHSFRPLLKLLHFAPLARFARRQIDRRTRRAPMATRQSESGPAYGAG